jgi:replicative DNA helicase
MAKHDPSALSTEAQELIDKALWAARLACDQDYALEKALHEIEAAFVLRDALTHSIPTGFPGLDQLLGGGLHPGNLVLIGGRPSTGKTALLYSFAIRALCTDIPVALFTVEMSAQQALHRLIQMLTGVDTWRPPHRILEDDEKARIAALPLWIGGEQTIADLRSRAMQLYAEQGVRMIVVDYIQLLRARQTYESCRCKIEEITAGLKSLSEALNVPVIAASQLSRAVEHRPDGRPRLSDLRGIEYPARNADVVVLIHRHPRNACSAQLLVEKNSYGGTGSVSVRWESQCVRFVPASKQETPDPLSL